MIDPEALDLSQAIWCDYRDCHTQSVNQLVGSVEDGYLHISLYLFYISIIFYGSFITIQSNICVLIVIARNQLKVEMVNSIDKKKNELFF